MNLLVTTETRYVIGQDGKAHCETGTRGYLHWTRYLEMFDSVTVIGRLSQMEARFAGSTPVEGPGVSLVPLPGYQGPAQYLLSLIKLRSLVRQACRTNSAVILHTGAIGTLVWSEIRHQHRPYGVEVVGDPFDVFAPGAVVHPLRPFFRWWMPRQLQAQCQEAAAVSYVTERTLQRRYPPGPRAQWLHCSDVWLPDAAFAPGVRDLDFTRSRKITVATVGSLAQLYKAPDVLIDAIAICVRDGLDLELVLIGDGKHRAELEERARLAGLSGRVRFLGKLPAGEAVRQELDRADLFILPSRTEGLPRALIEAMARGLPCIGSSVGGIPELLPIEFLVPPGDAHALALKIKEIVIDRARMREMSACNLAKAKEFRDEVLRERRLVFLRYVRESTERWLRDRSDPHK